MSFKNDLGSAFGLGCGFELARQLTGPALILVALAACGLYSWCAGPKPPNPPVPSPSNTPLRLANNSLSPASNVAANRSQTPAQNGSIKPANSSRLVADPSPVMNPANTARANMHEATNRSYDPGNQMANTAKPVNR